MLKKISWLSGVTFVAALIGCCMNLNCCLMPALISALVGLAALVGQIPEMEVDGVQYFIPLIALFAAPLSAMAIVDAGSVSGPNMMTAFIPLAALFGVALTVGCTWLSFTCQIKRRAWAVAMAFGLSSLLCLGAAILTKNLDTTSNLQRLAMCERVKEVGLRDFPVLANQYNLVTHAELESAEHNPSLTAQDREVIQYMLSAPELGQRIGNTHDSYQSLMVIGEKDFENYPQHIHTLYSAWEDKSTTSDWH